MELLGVNARYYGQTVQTSKGIEIAKPGCYIVALGKLAPDAKSWCDDPSFRAGVPDSCNANGKAALDALRAYDAPKPDSYSLYGVTLPEVYAEIALLPSGYTDFAMPRIVTLYYPRSLQWSNSDDARNLTLHLDFSSIGTLKPGAIDVIIPNIRPAAMTSGAALADQIIGWVADPSMPTVDKGTATDQRFMPVTINAKLKETGDPNIFLQAFAPAFKSATGDIAKAINADLIPSQRESAANQQQTDLATEESKRALVYTAAATYTAACQAVVAGDKASNDKARVAYLNLVAARRTANVAARNAGTSVEFDPPDAVTVCFS